MRRSIKVRSYKRRKPGGTYSVVRLLKDQKKEKKRKKGRIRKRIICFFKGHDLSLVKHKFDDGVVGHCWRCWRWIKIGENKDKEEEKSQ